MDKDDDPDRATSPRLSIVFVVLFALPILAWLSRPVLGVPAIGLSTTILGLITVQQRRIPRGRQLDCFACGSQ